MLKMLLKYDPMSQIKSKEKRYMQVKRKKEIQQEI